jgi:hypothetical protein
MLLSLSLWAPSPLPGIFACISGLSVWLGLFVRGYCGEHSLSPYLSPSVTHHSPDVFNTRVLNKSLILNKSLLHLTARLSLLHIHLSRLLSTFILVFPANRSEDVTA